MSNLKRELRVNKNGIAVTKIVRADAGTSEAGRSFPAPDRKRPATKAEYANAIAEYLMDSDLDTDESREYAQVMYVESLGGKSLKLLHDRVRELESPEERQFFEMVLMQTIRNSIASLDSQLTRDKIVSCLVEGAPVIMKFAGVMSNVVITSSAVTKASRKTKYYGVEVRPGSVTDEDRTMFRYLMFESLFENETEWRDRDAARNDARWFEKNTEALIPHAETIRARHSVDRSFLGELLRTDTSSALSEGIL